MGRPAVVTPAGKGVGEWASPRGGVGPAYLHKRCHSIISAGRLAGLRGRGWAGRRLCRPPAGDGLDAPPAGALGAKVGRFFRKRRGRCGPRGLDPYREARRGWVRTARRSEPYLGDADGTCGPRGLVPYREVGGPEGREGG